MPNANISGTQKMPAKLPPNRYLKEIAWNGIRLLLPHEWVPASVDPHHLSFENQTRPTMEIRWTGSGQRQRSRDSIYNRLDKIAKTRQCTLASIARPKAWQNALPTYEIDPFRWQNDTMAATGAVINCRDCGRTALLQFFHDPKNRNDDLSAIILASYKEDHTQNHTIRWALYDIQADIGRQFQLVNHLFKPGAFQLEFKDGTTVINLYRFAPASVILGERSLQDVASSRWSPMNGDASTWINTESQHPCLQHQTEMENSLLRRIHQLLGRRQAAWIRIWHLRRVNRIFAVHAQGNTQQIEMILADVAQNFTHF